MHFDEAAGRRLMLPHLDISLQELEIVFNLLQKLEDVFLACWCVWKSTTCKNLNDLIERELREERNSLRIKIRIYGIVETKVAVRENKWLSIKDDSMLLLCCCSQFLMRHQSNVSPANQF